MSTEIEPPTASTSSLLADRIDANDSVATPTSKLWITLDKPTVAVDAYARVRQLPVAFCAANRLNTTPVGSESTTSLGSVSTLAEA